MLISFQWASTQGGAHDDADITLSVSGDDRMLPIAAIGLLCSAAAIVPFLIGAIRAHTLKKKTAIALAASTLSISVVALLGMLLLYGAIAICGGWLFIWEPAVETIGAAKMLAASLRYTRPQPRWGGLSDGQKRGQRPHADIIFYRFCQGAN